MLDVGLAMANTRNGLVIIENIDRSLHRSAHADLWRMVLEEAKAWTIQVIASTYSPDSIYALSRAAEPIGDEWATYIRLEDGPEGPRAVRYEMEEIRTAADQGIHVD